MIKFTSLSLLLLLRRKLNLSWHSCTRVVPPLKNFFLKISTQGFSGSLITNLGSIFPSEAYAPRYEALIPRLKIFKFLNIFTFFSVLIVFAILIKNNERFSN